MLTHIGVRVKPKLIERKLIDKFRQLSSTFLFILFSEKDSMDVWCNGLIVETAVSPEFYVLLFHIL